MFTLYNFGPYIEQTFKVNGIGGSTTFLLLYMLGLLVANVPGYIKHSNNEGYRSLGASGAVSAVLFAFIVFRPWGTLVIYAFPVSAVIYAVLYIIYCIYMSKKGGDNIGHDAHLWGSIFGFVFTAILVGILGSELIPAILERWKDVHLFGN